MESFDGSCLCRAVRFRIEPPTKWCAHCHCSMCRGAHGAAFVTWFGVEREQFRFLSDEALEWYESSPGSERGFCGRCGSTMFFRSERWPGEIHVTLSNVEGVIDREPAAHVGWESHVSWVELADGLPRKEFDS